MALHRPLIGLNFCGKEFAAQWFRSCCLSMNLARVDPYSLLLNRPTSILIFKVLVFRVFACVDYSRVASSQPSFPWVHPSEFPEG